MRFDAGDLNAEGGKCYAIYALDSKESLGRRKKRVIANGLVTEKMVFF